MFRFPNNSLCGLPVVGNPNFCRLHSLNDTGAINNAARINAYINLQEEGPLQLSGVKFNGVKFKEVDFPDKHISFEKSSFTNCEFVGITFDTSVDFITCDFENTEFVSVTFNKGVSFQNRRRGSFKNSLLQSCNFHANADFKKFHSEGSLFYDTKFHSHTIFDDSTLKNTRFEYARFLGSVTRFNGANITYSNAPFIKCVFNGKKTGIQSPSVSFSECTVNTDHSPFIGCWIKAHSIFFNSAVFECDRLFITISEYEEGKKLHNNLLLHAESLNFKGFKCSGHFEYANHKSCRDFAPTVNFFKVVFPQMKSAHFIEANLEQSAFRYSVIENVRFMNCKWPKTDNNKKRNILNEDKSLRLIKSPSRKGVKLSEDQFYLFFNEVLQQYVQLKKTMKLNGTLWAPVIGRIGKWNVAVFCQLI